MSATRAAPPRQPASSAAVHRLTAWLQEAGVERTAGLLPATSHGAGPHADALLAASMPPNLQLDGVRT